jgi:signal transduction histidine kinase
LDRESAVKKLSWLMILWLGWIFSAVADEAAPLTRIADIRALSPVEAEKALPLKVRGVVTWVDPSRGGPIVVDDGEAGIWVAMEVAIANKVWAGEDPRPEGWEVGSLLEIEGLSDPGGYAPVILPRKILRVGEGALPPARPVNVERLHSGADDAQRVEIRGVVQQVEMPPSAGGNVAFLTLGLGDELCVVRVERTPGFDRETAGKLVDAEVRVRGVFTPVPNIRGEMVGLRMHAAGWNDVEVLAATPADPFAAPKVDLDRLVPFSPEGNSRHRKVTQGVVTFAVPDRFFFLQEGITGVKVQAKGMRVAKGDRVEVAGFVETSRWLASVNGALIRKQGKAPLPPALSVTVKQILHPDLWSSRRTDRIGDCDGRLVRVKGILRRVEQRDTEGGAGSALLQVEGDLHQLFSGELPALDEAGKTALVSLKAGSEVSLAGVCELMFGDRPAAVQEMRPVGFRLWISSPADIKVLRSPSWWTLRKLGVALAVALAALLGALVWISTLQRAVRRHAAALEESMRHHRDSELEFLSARKERLRLATDLHDGLQQMIIGVGFRMEAALAYLDEIPPSAQEEFQAARRTLMGTLAGLRECVWGLRHVDEGPGDFAALLRHGIDSIEHWPRGAVVVESAGQPYVLSRHVMGNLLLLVQEAVGNALNHGKAGHVRVMLNYDAEGVDVSIQDDGIGFDPAAVGGIGDGHFGLAGMRERISRLRGVIGIESSPGNGARISIRIPRSGDTGDDPLLDGHV